MGLDDALDANREGCDNGGYYGYHEFNPKLNEWVEELKPRFPEPLNLDYIEVSPNIDKVQARAHYDEGGDHYIRVAEKLFWEYNDPYIKEIVAHELLHVWMYSNGYRYDDSDRLFNWLLGYVNADLSGTGPGYEEHRIMEEFRRNTPDLYEELEW